MKSKTYKLVVCAIFTAVISVLSQIVIPISVVPISLASFAIMICGGVLGIKYGTMSTLLYILAGAVGIPVFSGFRGGIAILFGPTGGFIIGYLIIAVLSAVAFKTKMEFFVRTAILFSGALLCCVIGALWYMLITKSGFATSILTCVLPFLPGEIVKIIIAYPVIVRIKKQI